MIDTSEQAPPIVKDVRGRLHVAKAGDDKEETCVEVARDARRFKKLKAKGVPVAPPPHVMAAWQLVQSLLRTINATNELRRASRLGARPPDPVPQILENQVLMMHTQAMILDELVALRGWPREIQVKFEPAPDRQSGGAA